MALVAIPMLIASTIDRASAAIYDVSESYGVYSVAPTDSKLWPTSATESDADAEKLQLEINADRATAATYQLSEIYGVDSVAPAGKTPWLTFTTTTLSGADAGKVQLEFYASGLVSPEYVDEWYLNIDPALDPKNLSFDSPVKTGSFSLPTINLATDGYKAGPDGRFDIRLAFSTSNAGGGVNRFTSGDKLSYIVSYSLGSISAESFDFLSKPEGAYGPYHSAAKVLSTGPDASGSAWINSVPEPGPPLQALVLGTALLTYFRRRG
ncbi:MAG: hypothetical protein ACK49I_03170 [Verrucomicrobiota bacterium]